MAISAKPTSGPAGTPFSTINQQAAPAHNQSNRPKQIPSGACPLLYVMPAV